MDEKEKKINDYLDSYGISHSANGYCFLNEVIMGMLENGPTTKLQHLYKKVGGQCGITEECVASTIRYAISHSEKAKGIKTREFIRNGVKYAKSNCVG